eukprot:11146824-Lingulodinium_polyedra.AAC.1
MAALLGAELVKQARLLDSYKALELERGRLALQVGQLQAHLGAREPMAEELQPCRAMHGAILATAPSARR